VGPIAGRSRPNGPMAAVGAKRTFPQRRQKLLFGAPPFCHFGGAGRRGDRMKLDISVYGHEMAASIETSCDIGGSNSRADIRSRICRSISVPKGCWLLPARLQAERNSSGRGPLLWRRGSFDKRTHHNPPLGGKKQVGLPSKANSTAYDRRRPRGSDIRISRLCCRARIAASSCSEPWTLVQGPDDCARTWMAVA
jgi:hypothetical protein